MAQIVDIPNCAQCGKRPRRGGSRSKLCEECLLENHRARNRRYTYVAPRWARILSKDWPYPGKFDWGEVEATAVMGCWPEDATFETDDGRLFEYVHAKRNVIEVK